jgi:hypothetical protein
MLLVSPARELASWILQENTNGWTCIWYDDQGNEQGRAGYADAASQEEAEARFAKDHTDVTDEDNIFWYGPMDWLPPPGTKNDRL